MRNEPNKLNLYIISLGNISEFNRLAREFNAQYIIHTGDFGFYGKGERAYIWMSILAYVFHT